MRSALDGSENSLILRSTDGGLSWNATGEDVNAELDGIAFFDAAAGWTVGVDTILRTDDGGTSWRHQEDAVPPTVRGPIPDFAAVEYLVPVFIDAVHGFITGGGPFQITEFGGPSFVIVTEDGGTTWTPAPISGTAPALEHAPLRSACVTRTGLAIASGSGVNGDVVVLSVDAGHTWTEVSARTGPCVGAVACSGDRDLWIAGFDSGLAVLCHSRDGGVSWSSTSFAQRPQTAEVQDLVFVDDQAAWASGFDVDNHAIGLETDDAGTSWSSHVLPLGPGDTFLTPIGIAATSAVHAVVFGVRSDDEGHQGPLARTTSDGGVTWEVSTFPDGVFVQDVVLK
ncbi:MAG TPA: hypothetical protein VGK30_14870 [Candidatus Binatia bacterium]|jgi:photosystem II stability/assembly factor-like uncharacterized protein